MRELSQLKIAMRYVSEWNALIKRHAGPFQTGQISASTRRELKAIGAILPVTILVDLREADIAAMQEADLRAIVAAYSESDLPVAVHRVSYLTGEKSQFRVTGQFAHLAALQGLSVASLTSVASASTMLRVPASELDALLVELQQQAGERSEEEAAAADL
jgi:hypothetical protein